MEFDTKLYALTFLEMGKRNKESIDKLFVNLTIIGTAGCDYILARLVIFKIKEGLKKRNEETGEDKDLSENMEEMICDPDFKRETLDMVKSFERFKYVCDKNSKNTWIDSKREVLLELDSLLSENPLIRLVSKELGENLLATLFDKVRECADEVSLADLTTKEFLVYIGDHLEEQFPGYHKKFQDDLQDFTSTLHFLTRESMTGGINV